MTQPTIPRPGQPIIEQGTMNLIDRVWWRFFNSLPPGSQTGQTATGTTQADAFPITQVFTEFDTVDAGTGAILQTTLNVVYYVYNFGAQDLSVYPPAGAQIDALGANAPATVASGAHARFVLLTPTQAYTS